MTGRIAKPDASMPNPRVLVALPHRLAVCRLGPKDPLPAWASGGAFYSITRTADELSIVCSQDLVPAGTRCERDWRCLRVAGAMPFELVGVVAGLTAPLAAAGLSVFVLSTFDTDYLLVKEPQWAAALEVLGRQGYSIDEPT
jgi:nitrilase